MHDKVLRNCNDAKISFIELENKIGSKLDALKLQEVDLKNTINLLKVEQTKVKIEVDNINSTWETINICLGIISIVIALVGFVSFIKHKKFLKTYNKEIKIAKNLNNRYKKIINDSYIGDYLIRNISDKDIYQIYKLRKIIDNNFDSNYLDSLRIMNKSGLYFKAYKKFDDIIYLNNAIEIIKEALSKSDNNAEAYYDYGLFLIYKSYRESYNHKRKSILDKSIDNSKLALDYSNFTLYQAYYNIACAYSLKEDYDNAKKYLEELKSNIPNFSDKYIKFFDNDKLKNETDFDNLENHNSAWFDKFIKDFEKDLKNELQARGSNP